MSRRRPRGWRAGPVGSGAVVDQHTDVMREEGIAAAKDRAATEFGQLDVMVDNPGAGGAPSPITEATAEGFDRTTEPSWGR